MAAPDEPSAEDIAEVVTEPTFTIPGHEDWVRCIAWLPNDRIVTGSHDKTVRIWSSTDGTQEGASMFHEDFVQGVVATKDGRIISCGIGNKHLMVWNADTQELVNGPWLDEEYVWCIALSQNEELLASCHDDRIVFWEMVGSMRVRNSVGYEFIGGSSSEGVTSACFSPDGKRFAVCSTTEAITVLDVESGERIAGPIRMEPFRVSVILWSLDGARLFCGGRLLKLAQGGQILCLDSWTGENVGEPWITHQKDVRSLSLSPDGKCLASGSVDQTIRFLHVESPDAAEEPVHFGAKMLAVAFSRSGEFIACSGEGGHISVYRVPWWNNDDRQAPHPLLELSAVVSPDDGLSNIRHHEPDFGFLDASAPRRSNPSQDRPRPHPSTRPARTQSALLSWGWWKRIPRLIHDRPHPIYTGYAPPRTYVASRHTLDSAPGSLSRQVPTPPSPGHHHTATVVVQTSSRGSSDESTRNHTADRSMDVDRVGCCGLLSRRPRNPIPYRLHTAMPPRPEAAPRTNTAT